MVQNIEGWARARKDHLGRRNGRGYGERLLIRGCDGDQRQRRIYACWSALVRSFDVRALFLSVLLAARALRISRRISASLVLGGGAIVGTGLRRCAAGALPFMGALLTAAAVRPSRGLQDKPRHQEQSEGQADCLSVHLFFQRLSPVFYSVPGLCRVKIFRKERPITRRSPAGCPGTDGNSMTGKARRAQEGSFGIPRAGAPKNCRAVED